jgi:hypothetical protein
VSHELLYTSAPKGLKPGSKGFCTVVCTQGMPPPLSTALESLSAYRPVYPAGDRNSVSNPVVWSHVKLNAGGRAYHVLSRIADFGLDFSQRGNKLAHHIALEPSELVACGPAAVLEVPGTMDRSWNGQPRLLPAGRPLRSVSRPPAICNAWWTLAGDAGWAGEVAESFLQTPDRPVYIEFAPGMDLLPLMDEAIGLLPADRRWDVTFSTYFTSLPPGVTCAWRGVLSGSPEAVQVREISRALYINLCEPVRAATGGNLVQLARIGRSATSPSRAPQFAAADDNWTGNELAAGLELQPIPADEPLIRDSGSLAPSASDVAVSGEDYSVAPRLPTPSPPPPPVTGRRRRTLADLNAVEAAQRSKRTRWIFAGMAGLIVILAIGVVAAPGSREWVLRRIASPKGDSVARDAKTEGDPEKTKVVLRVKSINNGNVSAVVAAEDHTATEQTDSVPSGPSNTLTEGTDEAAGASNSQDGKTREDEPATPTAADAADASPNEPQNPRPTHKLPQLAGIELQPSEKTAHYEVFAISLEDAVGMKAALYVPSDVPISAKWSLHAPDGQSFLAVTSPEDPKQKITLKKQDGARLVKLSVLEVEKSQDANGLVFQFKDLAPGWNEAKWCLLSVKESGGGLRLFSLQAPYIELDEPRFKDSSLTLPFVSEDDNLLNSMIHLTSLELQLSERKKHLRFQTPVDQSDGKSLICELTKIDTEAMLFQQPELKLIVGLNQKGSRNQLTLLPSIASLKKSYENGLNTRLNEIDSSINNLMFIEPNVQKIPPANLKKGLMPDNSASESKALDNLKRTLTESVQTREDEIRKIEDRDGPGKEQALTKIREAIKDLNNLLATLKSAEKSRDVYKRLRDSLASAEILELSLQYSFRISANSNGSDPAEQRTVPIGLKFKKPAP